MENSIKILEQEIQELQGLIKANMTKCGNYPQQLALLIGEHLTAIDKLIEAQKSANDEARYLASITELNKEIKLRDDEITRLKNECRIERIAKLRAESCIEGMKDEIEVLQNENVSLKAKGDKMFNIWKRE